MRTSGRSDSRSAGLSAWNRGITAHGIGRSDRLSTLMIRIIAAAALRADPSLARRTALEGFVARPGGARMDRTDITGTPAWRGGFEASPLVVIWEVTRACDLACVHCRASAVPKRDPLELSTDEGGRLIRDLRGFGHPVFVLTGGDPLLRPDLETLVAAAAQERFPVALSPAGTPLLSHARLRRLRDAGLGSVSISLDGSCASVHDAFRRVPGSFETSLQGAGAAVA